MLFTAMTILCNSEQAETLSVLLQDNGYEGSWFEQGSLKIYIKTDEFKEAMLKSTLSGFNHNYTVETVEDTNWNAVWEADFKDSTIGDRIRVRAPFQELKDYDYEIIVNPKMAFGTGQHETTQLSALALIELAVAGKTVLDMGCGSGVLAILASKLGAYKVWAIDYDIKSVENTTENLQLNQIDNVDVVHSSSTAIVTEKLDIIISNIVKNINLILLDQFADKLNNNGLLLLSGFLVDDLNQLVEKASVLNLQLLNYTTKNNWLQATFVAK